MGLQVNQGFFQIIWHFFVCILIFGIYVQRNNTEKKKNVVVFIHETFYSILEIHLNDLIILE